MINPVYLFLFVQNLRVTPTTCRHQHRRNILLKSSARDTTEADDASINLDNDENSDSPYVFKGKHKWLGGAINPADGSIFGIPSNVDSVIQIQPGTVTQSGSADPTVRTIKLPSHMQKGQYKWLRGIVAHDHLYGIPAWSNEGVLKVSLTNHHDDDGNNIGVGTPTVLPIPTDANDSNSQNIKLCNVGGTEDDDLIEVRTDRWMWHGAALSANEEYIYCIPSNKERVLKVKADPLAQGPLVEEIGPRFHGQNKWYGGIRGVDSCIYGVPYTANGVLRIDPADDSVTMIGDFGYGKYNWHGGVLAGNGCIYCFPSHSSHLLKIDTNLGVTDQLSLIELPPTKDGVNNYKWLGGALGIDGAVYAMPCDTNSVLRIDPENDSVSIFGETPTGKNKWQGGVLGPDSCIYAVPADAETVLKIDTREIDISYGDDCNNDWRLSTVGSLPNVKKKWQGGFLASDGIIYAVSTNKEVVYIANTFNPFVLTLL